MKIEIVGKATNPIGDYYDKDHLWPEEANACFWMGHPTYGNKVATLVYQVLTKFNCGWRANYVPFMRGWNFGCADLIDKEDNCLVFGHLISEHTNEGYYLKITEFDDTKIKTMLQFGMEVVRQLELLI